MSSPTTNSVGYQCREVEGATTMSQGLHGSWQEPEHTCTAINGRQTRKYVQKKTDVDRGEYTNARPIH